MSLLNKENKTKTSEINIFEGNIEFLNTSAYTQEIMQNIFNELPPYLIISRYINYHGKILELEWDFTEHQLVSWVDVKNVQSTLSLGCTIKSKMHIGFTCTIKYQGCNLGKILFNPKLLEISVIRDCVRNLFQRSSDAHY